MKPEDKWVRLQEVGLSQLLAIPVAIVAGETFNLSFKAIVVISIALCWSGLVCFLLGRDKRRELREQKDTDCPKCP